MDDLARDILKAYGRDEHLKRTRIAPKVLAAHQDALEKRLTKFFSAIAPKIADAAAKRLGATHG